MQVAAKLCALLAFMHHPLPVLVLWTLSFLSCPGGPSFPCPSLSGLPQRTILFPKSFGWLHADASPCLFV